MFWLAGTSRAEWDWPLPPGLAGPKPVAPELLPPELLPPELLPPEPLAAEPLPAAAAGAPAAGTLAGAARTAAPSAAEAELLALLEHPASPHPHKMVPAMVPAMSTCALVFR
jgi:hypothetical protein